MNGKVNTIGLMLLLLAMTAFPVAADSTAVVEQMNYQGELFVGAINYNVPIETFDLPGGLSLNLAISYSSLGADELGSMPTLLGSSGWNLAGTNDRIIKVGQNRFVLIYNGIGYYLFWTSDGWQTNPKRFLKITRQNNGWSVINEEGRISYYGRDVDKSDLHEAIPIASEKFESGSEHVVWFKDSVEDVNGNSVKYHYTKYLADDGHEYSVLPEKIECCFDKTGAIIGDLLKEIIFKTSKINIANVHKKNGYWEDRILDAIEVWINGKPLRKYVLSYDQNKLPEENVIQNGNFETGNFNHWETIAQAPHFAEINRGNSGYYANLHRNYAEGILRISQEITVPRIASVLEYSVVVNGYGPFELKVYASVNGNKYLIDSVSQTKMTFEKQTVDLKRFADQRVKIIFEVEDFMGEVHLDDVSISSGIDNLEGVKTLKSISEWGSNGTAFNGTLPAISFEYGENLLTEVLNGYGGVKSFVYEEYLAHTEEGGYEENKRHRVVKINEKDGLGSISTTLASYKNDAGESTDLSVDGEFWGHGKVSVTLPSGKKIRNHYCQTDECKGMLTWSETLGNDGKIYSATVNKIESRVTDILISKEDQLTNPSFEGNLLGWKELTSLSGYISLVSGDSFDGNDSARLVAGGIGTEGGLARLSQIRTISEDVKNLSFMAKFDQFPEGSSFSVLIKDEGNYHPVHSGLTNSKWTEYEADISRWAGIGRPVEIIFSVSRSEYNVPEIIVSIDKVLFKHRTSLSFPYVSEVRDYTYGNDSSKMTLTKLAIDEVGSVIDALQYGEYDDVVGDIGTDKREIKTEYINDLLRNILGVPKHTVVSGFNINDEYVVQRESWMYYDGLLYGELSKGQITKMEAKKDKERNITTEQGYDDYGNVNWTIDSSRNINVVTGHTTDAKFVGGVYPIESCNALNQCSTIGYDQLMRPINFMDINGQVTSQKLDDFGRVIAVAKPGDALEEPTVQTVHGDIADFANGTYPYILTILKDGTDKGLWSYSFFNGFGNVIETKAKGVGENEWLTADTYYCGDECADQNSRGKLDRISVPYTITTSVPTVVNRKQKDEIGIWTVAGYDPVGRQDRTTKPDGTFTETVFGVWMKEVYDAMRHKIAEYSDGLGMTTRIENYLGNSSETYQLYATTSSKYNTGTGELVKLTDPAGNEQRIEYNLLGWRIWMHDPNFGNLSYNHNNNGIVINQTDAKGQTLNWTVDLLNRIIRKESPGHVDTVSKYDNCENGKGRLCMISGGDSKYKIIKKPSYDERGRTTNIQLTINDKSWNVSSGFDSIDRVVSTTYPDGEDVITRYNNAGFIDSPDGILSAVQSNLYEDYPYLKDVTFRQGKPESYVYGNGRKTSLEYNDRADRVDNGKSFTYRLIRAVTDGGAQDLGYGHDVVGKVVSVIDGLNSNNSADYKLDDFSRLVLAKSGMYGNLEFGYNNINNIIIKDGLSYTYPASGPWSVRPNAPLSVGNDTFKYDANGNMENMSNGRLFLWNPDNKVVRISKEKIANALILNTFLIEERIVKIEGGIITFYIGGIYEEEYWKNGTRKSATKYYSAGDATVIRTNQTVSNGFNETLRFVHKDHLGSSTVVTDEKGEIVLRIGYNPYGEEVFIKGKKEEIINNRFAGQKKDITVGLYCGSARCYDPALGIFMSADPVEGPNRYSYANNNPTNMIDPTGNFVIAAAAIPYIAATLPTVALVVSAYIGYNWNEGGADVMSAVMPLPISPGKIKLSAPFVKRFNNLGARHADEVAVAWEKWAETGTATNGKNVLNILSKEFDLTNVKSKSIGFARDLKQNLGYGFSRITKGQAIQNSLSLMPAFLFNWKAGAKRIIVTDCGLESLGCGRATIAHELQHANDWTNGIKMSETVLESRGHLVGAMTHVSEAAVNPAEIPGATSTWAHAYEYVSSLDVTKTATHDYAIYAWNKMDDLFKQLKRMK
jgi:RHS repeat-associated protein